jgi:AcrR family transcriptional regulator
VVVAKAPEPVRRRRHGKQLESALLATAWDELVEVGYARLTMESVAVRARTSEPVLYRRWANKDQLVFAAIEHHRNANPVATPDTGTLRGDLLAQLTAVSEALAGFYAIAAAAAFSGLLADTGLTPAQARDKVMDAQSLPRVRVIYQRAHDRGEIDLERIPAAVLAMPFDLVRHDLLMDLEPLRPARIQSIVDELFLPLLQNYQPVALPEHENLCGVVRGAVVGLQVGALNERAAGDLEAPAADVGDDAGRHRRIQIPGLARGEVAEPAVPLLYRRPVGVLAIDDVQAFSAGAVDELIAEFVVGVRGDD